MCFSTIAVQFCFWGFIWFYPRQQDASLVYVLVLGDLGHSPRTYNQCASLIKAGKKVVLFGFLESSLPPCSEEHIKNKSFKIVSLSSFRCGFIKNNLLRYFVKTILQTIAIFYTLILSSIKSGSTPAHFLVQNPPSIPALFVVYTYCQLYDVQFVIDWHNYGYSIMRVQKANSLLVKIAMFYEKLMMRLSDSNFTVTNAMKTELVSYGAANISVLYDKPHPRFQKLEENEKTEFLQRISSSFPELKGALKKPLIVSSTSWTEDEDFGILLDALKLCRDRNLAFTVAITGKGPQKDFYKREIKKIDMKNIEIVTPWLEIEDYPKLLGAATLGVSLHTSSSGCDLPMKVVDMFGAGCPAFALNFPAIGELVKDGKNGKIFNSADELAEIIIDHLEKPSLISEYRENLVKERISWEDHWSAVASPHFSVTS
ncbi:unnamed protein product [Oikopleura dioica]|uniref:Beta-1,4-mannosyltransferase n=1 Tax=Oikopleura dioica TaxID=34765 RepID=E4YIJ7_OIKDI|nr:unnamed protein product [Oikopleura dioica]